MTTQAINPTALVKSLPSELIEALASVDCDVDMMGTYAFHELVNAARNSEAGTPVWVGDNPDYFPSGSFLNQADLADYCEAMEVDPDDVIRDGVTEVPPEVIEAIRNA